MRFGWLDTLAVGDLTPAHMHSTCEFPLRGSAVNGTGGYIKFWIGHRNVLAHRAFFAWTYGRAAKSQLDHECENPWCVNVEHLREYDTVLEHKRAAHLRRFGHLYNGPSWCRTCARKRQSKTQQVCRDMRERARAEN